MMTIKLFTKTRFLISSAKVIIIEDAHTKDLELQLCRDSSAISKNDNQKVAIYS